MNLVPMQLRPIPGMWCHPFHGLWQTDGKQGLQPPSRLHKNVSLANIRLVESWSQSTLHTRETPAGNERATSQCILLQLSPIRRYHAP